MKMNSFMVEPEKVLRNGREVLLRLHGADKGPLRIAMWQIYRNSVFLEFEGVEEIAEAETLIGSHVFISGDYLETLPDDEFYWHDIIGMTVMTEDREILGRVTSIFPTGSNDVYVCTGGKGELLIPAIGDVVVKMDKAGREMIIRLLEGMDRPC